MSCATTNTLVIDQGGQSTRAIVFDFRGQVVGSLSEPVPNALPSVKGFIEYDADELVLSIRQLLSRLPKAWLSGVTQVAFIAQRSSIIACNKTGQALSPMISWQDTRNAQWLKEQPWLEEAGQRIGFPVNAHGGASKMRWLLDHDRVLNEYAQKQELLFMPWGAYCLQRLAQAFLPVTDPILASKTLLSAYGGCDWSDQLLDFFGIESSLLPKIMPSEYHYGEMECANKILPVMLLGGDQNFLSCAYGQAAHQTHLFVNIGTGAFIQGAGTNGHPNLLRTAVAIDESGPCLPLLEGTVNSAASAIDEYQQVAQCTYTNDQLNEILEREINAPVFINTSKGVGSPYWQASTPNRFLMVPETTEQAMLAVIESILFLMALNIRLIREASPNISTILISGGLSKLNGLCQRLSTLTALPVKRCDDQEASARGAAMYLGEMVESITGDADDFFPADMSLECREKMHERFQQFIEAMG